MGDKRWVLGLLVFVGIIGSIGRRQNGLVSAEEMLDRPVMVNLARRPDRFAVTKSLLEAAGFSHIERFDAADGWYGDPTIFKQLRIRSGSPGEKGCAASHLLIWKQLVESSDRDLLFVVEDDCVPHSQFSELFPQYWAATPMDFDLVMVGNQISASFQDPMLVVQPTYCTHAYIISKKGARKLLELYQKIPKTGGQLFVIDCFLQNVMQKGLINYYCYNGACFPDSTQVQVGNVYMERAGGICFQNARVTASIGGK